MSNGYDIYSRCLARVPETFPLRKVFQDSNFYLSDLLQYVLFAHLLDLFQ